MQLKSGPIKDQKGLSLIETMLAMALITVVMIPIIKTATSQSKSHNRNTTIVNLESLRTQVLALTMDQSAWNKTIERNPQMSCLRNYPSTCEKSQASEQGQLIDLVGIDGQIVISQQPGAGFDYSGQACNDFNISGNSNCPIRIEVLWSPDCSSREDCQYPAEKVSLRFLHKSITGRGLASLDAKHFGIINFNRRVLAPEGSPMITCMERNGLFVGFGQSVRNGDGQISHADQYGCVHLSALRGATGATGPRGARGPNSKRDKDPDPDPDPNCTADPLICDLYFNVLGHTPDASGATFWESQRAAGITNQQLRDAFMAVAEGRQPVAQGFNGRQAWENISAQRGLPVQSHQQTCMSNSYNCNVMSPEAAVEYNNMVSEHCRKNPHLCHKPEK